MIEEKVFFLPVNGKHLYLQLFLPNQSGPLNWGVILVPPLGEELLWAYRVSIKLARSLTEQGCAVLRFDPAGNGESSGDFSAITWEGQLAELDGLFSFFTSEIISNQKCGWLGIRYGASLVSAYTARSLRGDFQILWEPIISLSEYLQELLRYNLTTQLLVYRKVRWSRAELESQLDEGKPVNILGYPFSPALAKAWKENLPLNPPNFHLPTLIWPAAPLSNTEKKSLSTDKQENSYPPFWREVKLYWNDTWRFSQRFVRWLKETVPPTQPISRPNEMGKFKEWSGLKKIPGEEIVEFSNPGGLTLRGVLHCPADYTSIPAVPPAVLLLNAGVKPRSGPHQLYRELAAHLTKSGYFVLRFDAPGIGDSQGELSGYWLAEIFNSIEKGCLIPATQAAMRFLRKKLGVKTFYLGGLCGGALTSLFTAVREPEVKGVIALELPVLLDPIPRSPKGNPHPLTPGYARQLWRRYRRKVLDLSSWWRFLSRQSDYRLLYKVLLLTFFPKGNLGQESFLNPGVELALTELFRQKKRILLIFAANDPYYWDFVNYYQTRLQTEFKKADNFYRLILLESANHEFAWPEWQKKMEETVFGWLAEGRKEGF